MFVHQMRRAVIDWDRIGKFDEYLAELPDGFRRTLLPARKHIVQLMGLPADSVSDVSVSDDILTRILQARGLLRLS
jgi:hypothetical protein